MTQNVQAGIGMGLDLHSVPGLSAPLVPRAPEACRILRAREDIFALGVFQKPFKYFLHFIINHQLTLSRSVSDCV